jgi:hypothetical protein
MKTLFLLLILMTISCGDDEVKSNTDNSNSSNNGSSYECFNDNDCSSDTPSFQISPGGFKAKCELENGGHYCYECKEDSDCNEGEICQNQKVCAVL